MKPTRRFRLIEALLNKRHPGRRRPDADAPIPYTLTSPGEAAAAKLTVDDRPTGQKYPAALGVYCDRCGHTFEGDFVVSDTMTRKQRFEVARAHLRREGWSCTAAGDYCPTCVAALPRRAEQAEADCTQEPR